jgi:hypothetical protein
MLRLISISSTPSIWVVLPSLLVCPKSRAPVARPGHNQLAQHGWSQRPICPVLCSCVCLPLRWVGSLRHWQLFPWAISRVRYMSCTPLCNSCIISVALLCMTSVTMVHFSCNSHMPCVRNRDIKFVSSVLHLTLATHNNSHFFCNLTGAVFIHTKYTLCGLGLFFYGAVLVLFTADTCFEHLFHEILRVPK